MMSVSVGVSDITIIFLVTAALHIRHCRYVGVPHNRHIVKYIHVPPRPRARSTNISELRRKST